MTDPERIAAGLSEAGRKYMMLGRKESGAGFWPMWNALADKGLVTRGAFTPLGLEVRTILQGKDQ